MATDEQMTTDEVVLLPEVGENGTRIVRLPEGWLAAAQVQARRIGSSVVLEPVHLPAHPSWPVGFWEWVDGQRDLLDLGEVEPMDVRLRDVDLDDAP